MSEKRLVILRDQSTRRRAHEAIDAAPDGYAMRLAPATRSLEQSAKFHAICGDLARQLPYAGTARTLEQWKLLLVSAHAVATKEPTEVVPGLEGGVPEPARVDGGNVGRSHVVAHRVQRGLRRAIGRAAVRLKI